MDEKRSEIAVIGATPGGIAAAVRAAREGQTVMLITYNAHLGGMMASGLSYTDTLTKKARSPILKEFVKAVERHYASTYGDDSDQVERCEDGYVFEPHVAERVFDRLVAKEETLSLLEEYRLDGVVRTDRRIEAIKLASRNGGEPVRLRANVFVEATYEGDTMAAAGVPYRVGRENREEFGEQFAGRLFTQARGDRYYPQEAVGADVDDSVPTDIRGPLDVPPEKQRGELDLIPHPAGLTEIYAGSTGMGDDAIQAYNYRLCLSNDPENRRMPEKPPEYDPEVYRKKLDRIVDQGFRGYLLLRYLPNDKADMNAADLPGENHDYPEADAERREEIATRHRRHALGLLYFLQNDEAVPDQIQEQATRWGLARDEFTDEENFPWQLYVREARRLDGRYVFSENDVRRAPGLDRTPIQEDTVAIAEYPLDSHACHADQESGSQPDGSFYASQVTRPAQIPYRSLLPKGVDNLLVPVPLSATHVAYGTIRLEPTWMHVGEAAGLASSMAVDRDLPPADIDVGDLQRTLLDRGTMLSFFNELDMETDRPWVKAVQYLGTKGFFNQYTADPDEPLDVATADHWAKTVDQLLDGDDVDPSARARSLPEGDVPPITAAELLELLAAGRKESVRETASAALPSGEKLITRGDAARAVYRVFAEHGDS